MSKRDVTIRTTTETVTKKDLPAHIADQYEDLPFTSSNVLSVETTPSKPSKKG